MTVEDKKFLNWLAHRLVHKHNYSSNHYVVQYLESLCSNKIDDNTLDLIISKYYKDFLLDKVADMDIGYTSEERNNLRNIIRSLVEDVSSANIPNNTIK